MSTTRILIQVRYVHLIFLGFTRAFFSKSEWGVNPKCIDDYTVLERTNLTKLHIFAAKQKGRKHTVKNYFPPMTVHQFGVDPQWNLWRHVKPKNTNRSSLSDKARIESILNSFKSDPFYTHLVSLFAKEFSISMLHKPRNSRQKFCENARVFYHVWRLLHGYDLLWRLCVLARGLLMIFWSSNNLNLKRIGNYLKPFSNLFDNLPYIEHPLAHI